MPIGNLTSQLFANFYLNEFDHFIKETFGARYYLRYTDDFLILHRNPAALVSLLPAIRKFLRDKLALELHPRKIILCKLSRGIDFLGYVTLSHYRVLRIRTKWRMLRRLNVRDEQRAARLRSYFGLLSHCQGYQLKKKVISAVGCG